MSAGIDPQFEEVSDVGKQATTDQYDEQGYLISNNSVPLPDPNFRPASGDIATSPEQLNASAPPAPSSPDPYGGSVSASRANPDLSSEQKKELQSTSDRKGMQVFPDNAKQHGK